MQFTPKTFQQLTEGRLMTKGEGIFEITNVQKINCQDGREMWIFKTHGQDSNKKMGDARYMLMMDENWEYKYYQICHATGRPELYQGGKFDPEKLKGGKGRCIYGVHIDKNGKYEPENSIVKFLLPQQQTIQKNGSIASVIPSTPDVPDENWVKEYDDTIPASN